MKRLELTSDVCEQIGGLFAFFGRWGRKLRLLLFSQVLLVNLASEGFKVSVQFAPSVLKVLPILLNHLILQSILQTGKLGQFMVFRARIFNQSHLPQSLGGWQTS